MNNQPFAVSMSRHCMPEFAALMSQVIPRHSDENVQFKLINAIARNSGSGTQCVCQESRDMIYAITERLFNEASAQAIEVQDDGQWAIVMEVRDASDKASRHPQVADEIRAVMRPIILELLPKNRDERQQLTARLYNAHREMMGITYRILSVGS